MAFDRESDLGWHGDINRRSQLGTDRQGLMHRVLHKRLQAAFVHLLRPVIGRKHFLLDEVVEARPPFAGPQTRRGGAIVDHIVSVVRNEYGAPSAMAQPMAWSVALPSTSCTTAKLVLMPAPLISLPCT